jgi:uncharacterized membrane protein YfcA
VKDCPVNHYCSLNFDKVNELVTGHCVANPFFTGMDWHNAVVLTLVFLTSFIAAGSGGTGVGAVVVPCLISLMSLSATEAVTSAQAAICGGSLAAIIMFSFEGHPLAPQRFLFDVHAMLVLIPAVLIGVLFGGLIQNSLPRYGLFSLLLILSVWAGYKLYSKSIVMWKKETEAHERLSHHQESEHKVLHQDDQFITPANAYAVIDQVEPTGTHADSRVVGLYKNASFAPGPGEHAPLEIPEPVHKADIGNVDNYWWKLLAVFTIVLGAAACELIRGGHASHGNSSVAGIERCSDTYWIFTGSEALVILALSVTSVIIFRRQYVAKMESLQHVPGVDLEFSASSTVVYPLLAFVAGTATGAVGGGIGLICCVIMLELNMNPASVAATSAMIHLLGSSGVIISTAVSGDLLWGYAVALFAISFVGQLIGKLVFDAVQTHLGRPSLIIIAMAVMLTASTVLLLILGIEKTITDVRTGQHLSFNPIGNC